MATIVTKFDIGDKVWHPSVTTKQEKHPCPDCLGTRKWQAISPAGRGYIVECPRCSTTYLSNRDLSLSYATATGSVHQMTIGQVRFEDGPRYMCHETGVGSGSVYYETDLFATKEEAEAALAIKMVEMNAHIASQPNWIGVNDMKPFSDYQMHDARYEAERGRLATLRYKVGDFNSELQDAETLDKVRASARIYLGYEDPA
jgi:hypothetical protein